MPVILQVILRNGDLGLLAIAFPQTRVIHGPPFPMFLADRRLIVVNDDQPFRHYPDREVIQVTRFAKLTLDSRVGFLKFLHESCGTTVTAYQHDVLLNEDEVDDERFWREAKLARVLRRINGIPEVAPTDPKQKTTIVDIFDTLFADYGETYRRYRLSGVHHQTVLYSLMTMMERTRKPEGLQRTSRRYRDILLKNRSFYRRYQMALMHYNDNRERENKNLSADAAFLTFLFDCSNNEHLRERYGGWVNLLENCLLV